VLCGRGCRGIHRISPAISRDKKYAEKPKANWRCKECHGWDYRSVDGACKSGKHASGIKGINGAAGRDLGEIIGLLKDKKHVYGDKLGDSEKGAAYYNTMCANCLGLDGKQPKGMKPFAKQMGNPWEDVHKILNGQPDEDVHKILNGQPDEDVPALRSLDRQVVVDIMSHMGTLPK
jgi:thiosulfate dehydrogenase